MGLYKLMICLNLCPYKYAKRRGTPCEVRDKNLYTIDYKMVIPPLNIEGIVGIKGYETLPVMLA